MQTPKNTMFAQVSSPGIKNRWHSSFIGGDYMAIIVPILQAIFLLNIWQTVFYIFLYHKNFNNNNAVLKNELLHRISTIGIFSISW